MSRISFLGYNGVLSNIKSYGFDPYYVFDVGVAEGTPWLYEAFPNAYYYMFEPVKEFKEKINQILQNLKGELVEEALGSCSKEIDMFVPVGLNNLAISTTHFETTRRDLVRRIKQNTLDLFLSSKPQISGPVLLKTDVQGHDLDVLRGANQFLKMCHVVISEVPMVSPWGGGPKFVDYIDYMNSKDFTVFDFCAPLRRPYDDKLHSIDVVFVRKDLPYGSDTLYPQGEITAKQSNELYAKLKNVDS